LSVNAALGYLAVYPLACAEFVLETSLRPAFHLPVGPFYPSDGLGLMLALAAVLAAPLLAVFLVSNLALVNLLAVSARRYWCIASGLLLLPCLTAVTWPWLWDLIGYPTAR
jgi:hypothetical protein